MRAQFYALSVFGVTMWCLIFMRLQGGFVDIKENAVEIARSFRNTRERKSITVIACMWKERSDVEFLEALMQSKFAHHKLNIHICNNDPEMFSERKRIATTLNAMYDHEITIHDMGTNLYGYGRFVLAKKLLSKAYIDYIIMIDDDQYVRQDTIFNVYRQKIPLTFNAWYGKNWELDASGKANYWKPKEQTCITCPTTHWKYHLPDVNTWQYGGTGMSIIDATAFTLNELYRIDDKYMMIEDMWLSYILHKNNFSIHRLHVEFDIKSSMSSRGQWIHLKKLKQEFFMKLDYLQTKRPVNNWEFMHITKTGGSAIEKAAAEHGIAWGACHFNHAMFEKMNCPAPADYQGRVTAQGPYARYSIWHVPYIHWNPNMFKDKKVFTVVRNPYTRAVSEYYNVWTGYKGSDSENPSVMNKWIQDVISHPSNPLIYMPQYKYVYDDSGRKIVDVVLHFENLTASFNDFSIRNGLPVRLHEKPFNQRRSDTSLTVNDLDAKTIRLINDMHAKDFEYFGYKKHYAHCTQQHIYSKRFLDIGAPIFIHIPKTGGTTIESMFGLSGSKHFTVKDIIRCHPEKTHALFTILRHPIKRFRSLFVYTYNGGNGSYEDKKKFKWVRQYNFSSFLMHISTSNFRENHDIFFHSQSEFIGTAPKIEHVLCTERLDAEWDELRRIHTNFPSMVKRKRVQKHYTTDDFSELSPEVMRVLHKTFADDFRLWNVYCGYQKHSISVGIKTMNRPDVTIAHISSIRKLYPEIEIFVVDDGQKNQTDMYKSYTRLSYVHVGYDLGLSACRNRLVNMMDSEYVVIIDDDMIWNDSYDIYEAVRRLQNTNKKLLTIALDNQINPYIGHLFKNDNDDSLHFCHFDEMEKRQHRNSVYPECYNTDIGLNIILAQRSFLLENPWPEEYKVGEHALYFWLLKKNAPNNIIACLDMSVHHNNQEHTKTQSYIKNRQRAAEYLKKFGGIIHNSTCTTNS